MRTPLGPSKSVLIRGVSLFQGLFYIQKIHNVRLGQHTVSTLQWIPTVGVRIQGCLEGGVPLCMYKALVYSLQVGSCLSLPHQVQTSLCIVLPSCK